MKEVVEQDFKDMHEMLNQLENKLSTHLNKEEVIQYYTPMKKIMFAVWLDLCENKIPVPFVINHIP